MAARNRKGDGTSRILDKAKKSAEEGKYYEAHQMYRTVYYRYVSQRRNEEALDLVYRGASLLLTHEQFGSGLDLSLLAIERFNTDKIPVSDDRLDQIAQLFGLFNGQEKSRAKFIRAAIKWSSCGNVAYHYGHPRLHQLAAMAYWKERKYEQSRHHFLYADQMSDFSQMLVEMSTLRGYPGEYDLFVTQAVLHLLVLQKVKVANGLFLDYVNRHLAFPSSDPPFKVPLLNFLWLLLEAIDRRSVNVFRVLRVLYKPSLDRDADYSLLLDKVGTFFFGEPVPAENKGMLESLFGSLYSAFSDSDETDMAETAQAEVVHNEDLD